eukprot:SAG31_NODE_1357_length_8647_cov_8.257838_6_plen_114_part_00
MPDTGVAAVAREPVASEGVSGRVFGSTAWLTAQQRRPPCRVHDSVLHDDVPRTGSPLEGDGGVEDRVVPGEEFRCVCLHPDRRLIGDAVRCIQAEDIAVCLRVGRSSHAVSEM